MTTLIIEDEKLAAERLQLLLLQTAPEIKVASVIDSIEESLAWLKANPLPDLVFADIQLADGSAFEIFKHLEYTPPVIFTTAYDSYALDAFKFLSIDYLLKPVTGTALSLALNKLKRFVSQTGEAPNYRQLFDLLQKSTQQYKNRFVGKIGTKLFFINSENVAFFLADNKIVYLFTTDGSRYVVNYTLEELETSLQPTTFFRVNRSNIIRAGAIEQVKPYVNSRLKIVFKLGTQLKEVIVSRDKVSDFKTWADI